MLLCYVPWDSVPYRTYIILVTNCSLSSIKLWQFSRVPRCHEAMPNVCFCQSFYLIDWVVLACSALAQGQPLHWLLNCCTILRINGYYTILFFLQRFIIITHGSIQWVLEQKLVAMLKLIVDLYQEALVIDFTCVLRLIWLKINGRKKLYGIFIVTILTIGTGIGIHLQDLAPVSSCVIRCSINRR